MSYRQALEYITSTGRFGVKLGLERVRELLREAGEPQRGLRGALVAGTNGKGSTCAFLESILRAAGLRTGLMPKPHLSSYTERIQVNAVPISEADFAQAVSELRPVVARVAERLGQPTEFEILTALAVAYLGPRIDVLVCEVGMGGRLDATNVLDLGLAVITNVALDHQQYLGSTIEQIAAEKAAIIKPGNRVVSGCEPPARDIVASAAAAQAAPLRQLDRDLAASPGKLGWDGFQLDVSLGGSTYRDLHVPLLGSWQASNAALAIAAAEALGVSGKAVVDGVAATLWPGRMEILAERPRLIVDGAHNPAALDRVVPDLRELLGDEPVAVVFGAMEDKNLPGMLERLGRLDPALVAFTRAASAGERAADPVALAGLWGGKALVVESARQAVRQAAAAVGPAGTVLVCGSLYLVGEIREQISPGG